MKSINICYYVKYKMKRIGFVLLVIVLLLIINGLIHSIFDLWQKQDLLTSAQKELNLEQLKNTKLKSDLSYAQSQQFIDEEARNKLFLAKPGEQQIFISSDLVSANKEATRSENLPNWQKWLHLFF
jgi:cell division protein FtsB